MPSRAFLFSTAAVLSLAVLALSQVGLNALAGIFVFYSSGGMLVAIVLGLVSMPSRAFLFSTGTRHISYLVSDYRLNALAGIFVFYSQQSDYAAADPSSLNALAGIFVFYSIR